MDAENHCNIKVPVRMEDMRNLWAEASDKVRLEILKSVIWTAPNAHEFYAKAIKVLTSNKFKETID